MSELTVLVLAGAVGFCWWLSKVAADPALNYKRRPGKSVAQLRRDIERHKERHG